METVARRMLDPSEESQAVVTREDQADINRYARLLAERVEQQDLLKVQLACGTKVEEMGDWKFVT